MKWFQVIAKICKFLGQYHLIRDRDNDAPYLHRYYLFSTRWLSNIFPSLSYRVVLHHCVKSDIDGLHDHPWDWKSKILSGGYWEHIPGNVRVWRGPEHGWRSRKATDFHRLELDPTCDEPTWSLFVMGPRQKDWGFKDKNGNWVQHEEYLNFRHLYL